jgi:hypothetical protein
VSSIDQTAAFNPGDDGQRLIVIAVITARTVPILCKCPGIDSFLRWRRQVAKRDGPVFPQARSRTLIHLPQTLSTVRSDDAFLGTKSSQRTGTNRGNILKSDQSNTFDSAAFLANAGLGQNHHRVEAQGDIFLPGRYSGLCVLSAKRPCKSHRRLAGRQRSHNHASIRRRICRRGVSRGDRRACIWPPQLP